MDDYYSMRNSQCLDPNQRFHRPIPVIDLFAGPGGLSEGFASLRTPSGNPCFEVCLSIENDEAAHRTLELRAFVRAFQGRPPDAYYDYLTGQLNRESLFANPIFSSEAERARAKTWRWTLAEETHRLTSRRVREAVGNTDRWVLIGGPPCQAYSIAGRSRMRPVNPHRFERDERHFLYREYLRILADHEPPIFIMENVKGILSSTVRGRLIFSQILDDLSRPTGGSLRYRIVPFGGSDDLFESGPVDYAIRCEHFGIPQARHRVILCGIREDLSGRPLQLVPAENVSFIEHALSGLPPIRSRISREEDSHEAWMEVLREACEQLVVHGGAEFADVVETMRASLKRARSIRTAGGRYVSYVPARSCQSEAVQRLESWYRDPHMIGVTGHESRLHMRSDLHRYFFAASYAAARGNVSPRLRDFPRYLLPKHKNVRARSEDLPFSDRFRVQVFGRQSTTIVSHIAKDGHYYIHPDPAQCRSLTLREAARLQTFPDNYHFEGSRTQQLHQVGNAVPPLLARQIAATLWNFMTERTVDAALARPSGESPRACAGTLST